MGIRGSIIGDIAGSAFIYKKDGEKPLQKAEGLWDKQFESARGFTDNTLMTIACANAIADGKFRFQGWLFSSSPSPYGSFGSGSAARASACGQFAHSVKHAEAMGIESAKCTHNHPDGIKGAVTEAVLTYMAANGASKEGMLEYMLHEYPTDDYSVSVLNEISTYKEGNYPQESTCQMMVPLAFRCFYEAPSFEEMMKKVLSMNVDASTIGAIAGSWAEEMYGSCTGSRELDEAILERYLPQQLLVLLKNAEKNGRKGAKKMKLPKPPSRRKVAKEMKRRMEDEKRRNKASV